MKHAFLSLIVLISISSKASTFVGELQLDQAQTLSPADHHTLFIKRIRVVADVSAIEKTVLNVNSSNVSVDWGTDDVCNPRDNEITITGATNSAPIYLSFYEEGGAFHSSQQANVSFFPQQSFDQDFEAPIPTTFQASHSVAVNGNAKLLKKIDLAARMATSLDSQNISIEITGIRVNGAAEYSENNISNQHITNVVISYRAYPRDQNPANPMELAVGQAVLKLTK